MEALNFTQAANEGEAFLHDELVGVQVVEPLGKWQEDVLVRENRNDFLMPRIGGSNCCADMMI